MRARIRLIAIGATALILVVGSALLLASGGTDSGDRDRKVVVGDAPNTTTSTSTTTTTAPPLVPSSSAPASPPQDDPPPPPPPPPAPPHISANAGAIPMTPSTSTYTVLVFVTNDGGVPVAVAASSGGGYFSVLSRCPNPLGVGARCQVDISFDGASAPAGTYSTTLQISAAGGNSISIPVTATDTY